MFVLWQKNVPFFISAFSWDLQVLALLCWWHNPFKESPINNQFKFNAIDKQTRYGNDRLPRNERICVYCDLNDMDEELHLLLKCPCLNNLRNTFIPTYYYNRISMFKLIELLKSENSYVLNKLCKFIKILLTIGIH